MTKKTIGFTLIELLIVVAIISILAAIITVAVSSARVTARDTKRKSDLKTMQNALENYYYKRQKYLGMCPTYDCSGNFFSPWDKYCPVPHTTIYWGCGTLAGAAQNNSYYTVMYDALVPDYLAALPTDPINIMGG